MFLCLLFMSLLSLFRVLPSLRPRKAFPITSSSVHEVELLVCLFCLLQRSFSLVLSFKSYSKVRFFCMLPNVEVDLESSCWTLVLGSSCFVMSLWKLWTRFCMPRQKIGMIIIFSVHISIHLYIVIKQVNNKNLILMSSKQLEFGNLHRAVQLILKHLYSTITLSTKSEAHSNGHRW